MYGQIVPYPFGLVWYCSSVLLDKLSHIVVKLSELVHAVQRPGRAAAGSLSLAAPRLPQDAMLHCSAAMLNRAFNQIARVVARRIKLQVHCTAQIGRAAAGAGAARSSAAAPRHTATAAPRWAISSA